MTVTDATIPSPCEQIPEAAWHPDIDQMLFSWATIACIAWEGFLLHGRGVVHVGISDDGAHFSYQPGAPCRCDGVPLESYDPAQEVLVAVHRDDNVELYELSALPTPPESYAVTRGELYGATVQ